MVVAASAGPAEMVAVFGAASKSSASRKNTRTTYASATGRLYATPCAPEVASWVTRTGACSEVSDTNERAPVALFSKITRTSDAKSAETTFPSASTRSKPNAPSAPATRSGFAEASKRTAATSPGTTVTVNASTVAPAVPGDVCVTVTA